MEPVTPIHDDSRCFDVPLQLYKSKDSDRLRVHGLAANSAHSIGNPRFGCISTTFQSLFPEIQMLLLQIGTGCVIGRMLQTVWMTEKRLVSIFRAPWMQDP